MLPLEPLQVIDDILQNYEIGQVVLLLFVLVLPAGVVQKSRKITSINLVLFGLLFVIVPSIGGGGVVYALLGVALLVIGPVLYTTGTR